MIDRAELAVQIGRAMKRCTNTWHTDEDWPMFAELQVMTIPTIRRSLLASDALDRVVARHAPVRWAEGSATVVCKAGCGAYPCEEVELIEKELAGHGGTSTGNGPTQAEGAGAS